MNLSPIRDDCQSAAEVLAKARLVFERRRQSFLVTPPPVIAVADESAVAEGAKQPRRFFMWPMAVEIARQIGIEASQLKCGKKRGRGNIPLTQYRQLAMALAVHLTGKSLPRVGQAYGADHTTVLHAKRRMGPIIDAVGLTEENHLQEWVSACLPLLFAYIEQLRIKGRERSSRLFGGTNQ